MMAMSDPENPQGAHTIHFPAQADRAAAQFMSRLQAAEVSPEGVFDGMLVKLAEIGDRLLNEITPPDVLLYAAVLGHVLRHLETYPRKNLPPQLTSRLERDFLAMDKGISAIVAKGQHGEARQMKHALGRILGMCAHLGIGDAPPRTVVPGKPLL